MTWHDMIQYDKIWYNESQLLDGWVVHSFPIRPPRCPTALTCGFSMSASDWRWSWWQCPCGMMDLGMDQGPHWGWSAPITRTQWHLYLLDRVDSVTRMPTTSGPTNAKQIRVLQIIKYPLRRCKQTPKNNSNTVSEGVWSRIVRLRMMIGEL